MQSRPPRRYPAPSPSPPPSITASGLHSISGMPLSRCLSRCDVRPTPPRDSAYYPTYRAAMRHPQGPSGRCQQLFVALVNVPEGIFSEFSGTNSLQPSSRTSLSLDQHLLLRALFGHHRSQWTKSRPQWTKSRRLSRTHGHSRGARELSPCLLRSAKYHAATIGLRATLSTRVRIEPTSR